MKETVKIGIIICARYRECAGGKCFRALRNREGAFRVYEGKNVELAGYTTCGGCPGGNVEHTPTEMIRNGVTTVHLATGLIVGYPPCPYLSAFKDYLETKFALNVVVGTHPIPQKYLDTHTALGTWDTPQWRLMIAATLADEETRRVYD